MTTPPTITAASRIAVWICTGMRSTKAFARNAPGMAIAPIRSAKASTCAVTTPARPNTEILIEAGHDRDHGVGGNHRRALEPDAINSDSRITPEPEVPPTSTPYPTALTPRPVSPILIIALPGQPAQRHAQHQHAADHQRRAGAGEPRIAVGAERGGQCGRRNHDQRAAPVGVTEIGHEAADIGDDRRDRDDRHHRLGADQRHQHQRHQGAGAIAGKTADDGGQQRHAANQHELAERNVGEAGENIHSR